jgi:hypothetical protein
MKTLIFLTAENANLTQDNKINIFGIFNQINSVKYPAVHPSLSIVIKVSLELGEDPKNRKLTLYFAGPDANQQQVKMMENVINFPPRVGSIDPEHVMILNVNGLVIPKEGTFQFLLHLDDRFLSALSLNAALIEAVKKEG